MDDYSWPETLCLVFFKFRSVINCNSRRDAGSGATLSGLPETSGYPVFCILGEK